MDVWSRGSTITHGSILGSATIYFGEGIDFPGIRWALQGGQAWLDRVKIKGGLKENRGKIKNTRWRDPDLFLCLR